MDMGGMRKEVTLLSGTYVLVFLLGKNISKQGKTHKKDGPAGFNNESSHVPLVTRLGTNRAHGSRNVYEHETAESILIWRPGIN
jgi:hypothetical protein